MTIPSHHSVGDPGHTDDHNSMVDVLTAHENRVAAIEAAQPTYMVKTGNNTVTVSNPSGVADQVIVPSGPRETNALVRTVTVAGKQVWWLDAYGMQRLEAASADATPLVVAGYDNSQSGDLQQWRKHIGGDLLARIDRDGNVHAPNVTPSPWTNLTLASGIAWNSSLGARPAYRKVGDTVELRGNIRRSNNADFTVSPQEVGTLPTDFRPPHFSFSIQPATFRGGFSWVRMGVHPDGKIEFYFWFSSFNPDWVSLDGLRFSVTP